MTGGRTSRGLSQLSDQELAELKSALEQGVLRCPLGTEELEIANLGGLADRSSLLFGHSEPATLALLEAVQAERASSREQTKVEFVWTGPDVARSTSRDTSIVVRELFDQSRTSVIVAGFSFDKGKDIFAPLHRAMRQHGVSVDLFLDIPRRARAKDAASAEREAAVFASQFLTANWPFGPPEPSLYYDPRTLRHKSVASLHAKCVVVDEKVALVTSANFTDRGQTRNIEVGVLVEDPTFCRELTHQWHAAVREGFFLRIR